jgi:outer membrane protein assembly factor BamB
MIGNGRLFISHTHVDNERCEPLLAALDAWQVKYWFDTAELSAGQEFADDIAQAIAERDVFLRVCTPATEQSGWMAREERSARQLQTDARRSRSQRLIIDLLLIPGYRLTTEQHQRDCVIDATSKPAVEWLRELRVTLGVAGRDQRVSRRAILGLGVTSLGALGALGYAGRLLLTPQPAPAYAPTTPLATASPQSGSARLRWSYTIGDPGDVVSFGGSGISVGVFETGVIGVSDTAIFSLRPTDGALKWSHAYPSLRGVPPAPTVSEDSTTAYVVIFTTNNVTLDDDRRLLLLALNTQDGTERWRAPILTASDVTAATAVFASRIVRAGDLLLLRYMNTLVALSAYDGGVRWRQAIPFDDANIVLSDPLYPPPTAIGPVMYASAYTFDGLLRGDLTAYRLSTGAPQWGPRHFGSGIRSEIASANDLLYVGAGDTQVDPQTGSGTQTGLCVALDAQTGAERWRTTLIETAFTGVEALGVVTASTPVVADGVVYIGCGRIHPGGDPTAPASADALYALDARSGAVIWRAVPSQHLLMDAQKSNYISSAPLVHGAKVYVTAKFETATYDMDVLYALDKQTGQLQWAYEVPSGSSIADRALPSAPIARADLLYFASGAQSIYAFSLS